MLALPIDPHLDRIVEAVRRDRGVVLVAEPGAGKTTRVPRALLDAGFKSIVVVEPRRIAARMAAARVSEELGEKLGERIGYQVRFERRVSKATRVTFVTEGILARRLDADPTLTGVSVVVFDELHERHLETDLALARARLAQQDAKSTLHIVAMSATLEAEPVAEFLGVSSIAVEGRTHPIEIRFAEREDSRPLERQVRKQLVRLLDGGISGDVLVFLPGAAEIRRAMEACAGPSRAFKVDLLPLHGDLPAEEQDRAVHKGRRQKVIFSTNVAETSLTIDGVVAVIDSGLARVARHSVWTGLGTLETLPISRASATQRAGRAGRTQPGVCARLYTKRDHDRRPERDAPEIARADLCRAALSLYATALDPVTFSYFEAPPAASLDAARSLLRLLGALDEDDTISALGRSMLTLPVHPRTARVAIEAERRGHRETGAMLAALIEERDVRRSSRTQFRGAQFRGGGESHDEVGSSDLLANIEAIDALGGRASANELRHHGLDARSVRTVRAAAKKIAQALGRIEVAAEPTFDEEEVVALAVLSGFPDRVARRRKAGSRDLALSGGGTATLDEASVVKLADLMVAVDATLHRGRTVVRRASAVTVDQIMELFLDRLEDVPATRFNPDRERVEGVRELRLEGLTIERTPREPTDKEAAATLASAALSAGLQRFCDMDALEQLRCRLVFAQTFDETLPSLEDEDLERVLRQLAEGRRSFAELEDAKLLDWVRADLGDALRRLDAIAPEHVAIPGRKKIAVTYERERPPWIQSRLQDFFSALHGPTVAEGRAPLVLHLLAPNRRAVQVTTDLAGFWDRHYPDIRKELSRRYPRHSWPEDPRTATPPPPRRGARRR